MVRLGVDKQGKCELDPMMCVCVFAMCLYLVNCKQTNTLTLIIRRQNGTVWRNGRVCSLKS